jgi:hypothetical protein
MFRLVIDRQVEVREIDERGFEFPVFPGIALEPARNRGTDPAWPGARDDDMKLQGQGQFLSTSAADSAVQRLT